MLHPSLKLVGPEYGSPPSGCIMQPAGSGVFFVLRVSHDGVAKNLSQSLPPSFKQCVNFLEKYEPEAVDLLAEMMDPTFVCGVSIAAKVTVHRVHSEPGSLHISIRGKYI